MKLIRAIIGKCILLADQATSPRAMQRSEEQQHLVNKQTSKLAIYQFHACPFCVKVRRELKRLNLDIELRDAKNNADHKRMLIQQGGKHQVPCLQIEENESVQWLYESDDIIAYLRNHFTQATG